MLLALLAAPSYADSDGYYCAAEGYLAIEFRSFNTPEIGSPHVLRIARYDDLNGPRWTGEIPMEDFQVHVLVCGASEVVVEGVGSKARGLVTYTVEVGTEGVPRVGSVASDPGYAFSPREGPQNLGNWAQPGVVVLPPSPGTSHRFQARVTRTTEREEDGLILQRMKTALEELNDLDEVVRELPISSGTLFETVD